MEKVLSQGDGTFFMGCRRRRKIGGKEDGGKETQEGCLGKGV